MTPSLKELRLKQSDNKAQMQSICAKETDDSPLSDDDITSFQSLKDECDRLEARIARLAAAMSDDADDADDVDADDTKAWTAPMNKTFAIQTTTNCRVAPKHAGERTGRWLVGQYYVRNHGLSAAKAMVEKTWGDELVAKTMLTTSQPIIPQDFNADWIELLNAKAVIRSMNPTVYPMPNGNMTIPRQRLGSVGSFFGEGQQITVSNLAFDNLQLSWHKYGAMTYTSRELLEFTPLAASSIIANDLTDRLALLEDRTFLLSTGSTYTLKGIVALVNAANILPNTTSSGAVTFQTVSADLQSVELQMTANLITGELAWIMHPSVVAFLKQISSSFGVYPFREELSTGKLNGHKVVTTTQLPTNLGTSGANLTDIILVKPQDLIIGDAYRYAISMTTEGSFVDGSTQVNPFGQDLVAWKITNAVDFSIKHDVSAAILQASAWSLGYTAAGIDEYVQAANTTGSSASSAQF